MKEYMLYLEKMKMILGIDRERKIVNIKGLAKFTKARYKSSKSVLEHIIDLTKDAVMNILTEIGYVEEFNDKVRFSFDSDENVQRKYLGNYGLRLHDD